jgi:hypothetical protein
MDRAGTLGLGHEWIARRLTWAVAFACVVLLAWLVIAGRGNLGWDDADYLRRGLSDARLAVSGNPVLIIPRALDRLLQERPKPPFLVGWIEFGALLVGRSNLNTLIVLGSVAPFCFLVLAVVGLARQFHGHWSGLFALVVLIASPRTFSFGGKIMVETFLALWVLLALALASLLLKRPCRGVAVALGLVAALAFLTKLTAGLLLAGALVPFFWLVLRRDSDRRLRLRVLCWATLTCLAVAAPWYVRNAASAVRFASYSSRFNLVAEGQTHVTSGGERLVRILADLPGWPLAAILGIVGCCMSVKRRQSAGIKVEGCFEADSPSAHFRILTVASLLTMTAVLMIPPYFDTRFLLPIWPPLAVVLGGVFAKVFGAIALRSRALIGAGLAVSLTASVIGLVHEPTSTTCWAAQELIDRLVGRHGVASLANVGNIAEWNVCKTGLINELRKNSADCFVLHDLSAESAEGLRSRLPRFDAVVVLETSAFPAGFLAASPALNRAHSVINEIVQADPELIRAEGLPLEGLPPMAIFVRDRENRQQVSRGQASCRANDALVQEHAKLHGPRSRWGITSLGEGSPPWNFGHGPSKP